MTDLWKNITPEQRRRVLAGETVKLAEVPEDGKLGVFGDTVMLVFAYRAPQMLVDGQFVDVDMSQQTARLLVSERKEQP